MRKLLALASFVLLIPAMLHASSLEDLLVEKGVITKSEAMAASGSGTKVYWKGGTRLDFADAGFSVKINTQLQARYEFTDNETGTPNTSSFKIRRARLILKGKALHNEFSYKLQTDFVGKELSDGSNGADLRDAWLAWHACDYFDLKMGQMKTQLSRQYNTSSSKLQFADRSEVSEYFDYDRQAGLKGVFNLAEDRVMLAAGVYNGTSDGEGRNRVGVDTNHLVDVSLRAHLMGEMNPFEEGDIHYTEDAALNAGVTYAHADAKNTVTEMMDDTKTNAISADVNFKYQGASVHAELLWRDYEADMTQVEYDNVAFYVQGGYFVDPKKWEIAARYGYIDCDDGMAPGDCAGNDDVQEVAATVNYYWWKHALKAQFGYAYMSEGAMSGSDADVDTNRWLFQLSSYF